MKGNFQERIVAGKLHTLALETAQNLCKSIFVGRNHEGRAVYKRIHKAHLASLVVEDASVMIFNDFVEEFWLKGRSGGTDTRMCQYGSAEKTVKISENIALKLKY